MDNQKGGQANTPPSWNAWGQMAAKNASNNATQNVDNAKAAELSSMQKQQQTATELARKRVLEAYKHSPQDYKAPTQSSPAPQANADDWRRYHSAWQDYYQKYYGEYYGKVAREYVARERLRMEREQAEQARKHGDDEETRAEASTLVTNAVAGTTEESEIVQNDFRERIRAKAEQRARKMKRHRKWIPLAVGIIVLILGVLYQYKQVIAAHVVAYMSPGNSEVNSLGDLDPTITVATHEKPTVMIPKINVEVPINFGYANDWRSMNEAMSTGVAHFSMYGANAKPGEIGNFVVSGHSAGNVYQRSDWKFVFSGLTRMSVGDMMYVDYEGTRYAYQITGTNVVDPSDVAALRKIAEDNSGKPMITLITCTPLGTDKYRLLVFGEQVSPDYANAASSEPVAEDDSNKDMAMPSNEKTPLEQLWDWLIGE